MLKPNYKNGSIVNLMASIGGAMGWKSPYNQLKILPSKELKAKNIVLIVIDALGYDYLLEKGKKTGLYKHLRGGMTSVFPPTTASAITTFQTGLAPQQHAVTGWFMFLKEIGAVSVILPFVVRQGRLPLKKTIRCCDVLEDKGFFSKLNRKSYFILHSLPMSSEYNFATSQKSKKWKYNNLQGYISQISKAINQRGKKYIYAYWGELDSLGHKYGMGSKQSEEHFFEVFEKLNSLIKKHKDTIFIITADHGHVDCPAKNILWLDKHPKLKECLVMPFCGDKRAVYCYVHPSKTNQFEKYVKTKLKKYCTLFKSGELVKKNYYGLFKPNPKLFDRIGDYALIFKSNYLMKDLLIGEDPGSSIGRHGGLSSAELYVPLIVVKT